MFEDEEFTRMCPVGYSAGDKAFLPDLDTLLSTPTGPGLSHVRMALARYVLSPLGIVTLPEGWVFDPAYLFLFLAPRVIKRLY